ncbi:uncharacterized protein LOC113523052 [Galleria mellonella]|uniref:Uncharacterized protein LOC113523052 n=1 Tax=Galleria mellonella TaxID=7137 RepID=A0A6J1X9C0_GALME|nr:uncharacterized protein LOC113523052 [Galleria mellonella]
MLCIFLIIVITTSACAISNNVGTAIFYNRARSDCWNQEDLAKLRARKTFEQLMPSSVTPDKIDKKYTKDILRYFQKALQIVKNNEDVSTRAVLKEALADTIGGYLRSELLPTVRFAYYAGYIPYRNARQLHDFFDELKMNLNTQGWGWKEPDKVPSWSNLTVVRILIGAGKFFDPCACLVTIRDSNSCIHLPLPKLDDYNRPSAIALPFRTGGLVSLSSPYSQNILLKYYTTVSRCILHNSPKNCRHSDFVNFNNELWHWMKREVAPHLVDEKLYAAYGGVLRIAAAVQSYGKGLSRRNLFEYESAGSSSTWSPWKTFTQSFIYINADWTPQLYIGLVLLAALAICILQMCYNYIFGDANICHCTGRSKKSLIKDVEYNKVDSSFPAILSAHQSAVYYSEKKRTKLLPPKTKTFSLGSIRTQKVYDLNENTEKLMAVIMSSNENSIVESPLPSKDESDDTSNVMDTSRSKRSKSPPKLETSIAQLRIDKTSGRNKRGTSQMYSTSTLTRSDVTYCRELQESESVWTGTESCTCSSQSASTGSSKSRSRKSRSSRDLAWARRVISRHSAQNLSKSTTGTELDIKSYMIPPSQR